MESQAINPGDAGLVGGIILGLMIVYRIFSAIAPRIIDSISPSKEDRDSTLRRDTDAREYYHERTYQEQVLEHMKKISEIQRDSLYLIGSMDERIERLDKEIRSIRHDAEISKSLLQRMDASLSRA